MFRIKLLPPLESGVESQGVDERLGELHLITHVKMNTGMDVECEQNCTSIFRNIMRIRHVLNSTATEVAKMFDLRGSEMAIIDTLGKYGPLTMNELARACFFSPPNATYTVSSLEKSNLLKRERSSDSQRVVNVHLSKAGEKIFKKSYPTILHEVSELLDAKLTKKDRQTLANLLDKLME